MTIFQAELNLCTIQKVGNKLAIKWIFFLQNLPQKFCIQLFFRESKPIRSFLKLRLASTKLSFQNSPYRVERSKNEEKPTLFSK